MTNFSFGRTDGPTERGNNNIIYSIKKKNPARRKKTPNTKNVLWIVYSNLNDVDTFTSLAYFPSRKRRISGVSVDAGIRRCHPDLVIFVQPGCNGRSALLKSFLAMHSVKCVPINHQSWLSIITATQCETPVKDIQPRRRGCKAAIACAECIADICF